jgi:hypothetical protein
MGLFENSQFPYTNFHELNLDKIVDVTKDAKETAGRAETKADQAAATVETFDERITANTEAVTNLQSTTANHEERISYNERMIAINGDLITANTTRYTVLNEKVNNLDSELDTKIQEANTRMDGLDTTDTQLQANIDRKSTVIVEQGTLDGGVLAGTIYVDGTPTRLYAPTAGSTVVRAVDVPYTADPDAWIDEVGTQLNPIEVQSALDILASSLFGTALYELNQLFYKWVNDIIKESFDSLITSGFITTSGSEIWFTVPYSKKWNRPGFNPIDMPTRVQFSISGHLTVRGTSGYVMGDRDFNDTSISQITISAREAGYQVVLKMATAVPSLNNTPVTVRLTNQPTIQMRATN